MIINSTKSPRLTSENLYLFLPLLLKKIVNSRSQWPRGLRRRSAAARLLGFRVRIPPATWMSVLSVLCCQVEVSETGISLVQGHPIECLCVCACVCVCVRVCVTEYDQVQQ